MLLLLLLCISWTWSAVLSQNPPKLPHTPDEISVSFICTAGSGTDTQEASVGEIYYSKILNKGAVVIKRSGYTEHLVFNYNTSQVLVTTEKIAKHCDYVDISSFVDGSYNPKVLISMLTNDTLKFIADENSFGDIPGKLWQGNAQGFGETINVTYNELPWTFSSSYITNVSRPISLIGMDNKGAVLGYYFFGATNSVPHEAFMPPRGIFCRSFDDSKESGPTLPLAFRVDAEVYKEDTNYGSKIFYNGNLNVSRNDIITDYENRHSMITDRNYGVMYMIDSNTGVCKPLPLQEIDQGSTTSLLLFDNDDIASFKYIGNRSCWQGNCEVWSGVKDGFMYNLYLKHLKQNIDGGLLDSQYIPIQLNINWNGISQEESSMFREYYYNFEAGFPAWEKFDVSNCYKETHKLRFQITFQGSFFGIASIPDFERNVRLQIMQLTQIPEMRMHKFRVDNMLNEFVVVTLTILEDPRLAQIQISANATNLPVPTLNYHVYFQIENAISEEKFKVATTGANGKPIIFNGISSTNNIMSEKNIDGKGASLMKFKMQEKMRISTTISETVIEGLTTVDACARHCDKEHHSLCNMFMFCKDTQACVMSESMFSQRPDKHEASNCDLYTRDFAYDFKLYPGVRLLFDKTTDSDITGKSLESCFASCRSKTDGSACHSMDFCNADNQRSCIFHTKHYLQSTHVVSDPHCLHYSQEFLRMYRPLPGKSIKDASTRYTDITYDVTATECAKNCFLDPAGCIDFEMCKPFPGTKYKSVCHVLEPKLSTFDEKPEFVENIDCDHYRLIGVHTDFKFDYFNATNDTSNLSAGGYGSGSMAALAIPMLLIAAAVGAGAVYFYIKRQKLKNDDASYIMKFVRETE